MSKVRVNQSYNTLEDIIQALSKNEHASGVWVGENYSKQDLINDLEKINSSCLFFGGAPGGGMSFPEIKKQKIVDELENHSFSPGLLSEKFSRDE